MNAKFNLGNISVSIPAGDLNPEINVSISDVSYEVTDMSLTEYGSVLKSLMTEVRSFAFELSELNHDNHKKDLEYHERIHEMRMAEMRQASQKDDSPLAGSSLPAHV